jgi:F0F1-type ATP synthase membrane subunit c/vacuolar-type H+-ATPase subunit K
MNGSLHVGLAALGAALRRFNLCASRSVGRNPDASTKKILVQSILAIAFAEAIVFCPVLRTRTFNNGCGDTRFAPVENKHERSGFTVDSRERR